MEKKVNYYLKFIGPVQVKLDTGYPISKGLSFLIGTLYAKQQTNYGEIPIKRQQRGIKFIKFRIGSDWLAFLGQENQRT